MAGFKPARPSQAAVKMSLYGKPGTGKTFTALLFAEGLAQLSGKKVAYADSEHGTDFYCQAVPDRLTHPAAFVFDALYTRSLTEILTEVKQLSPTEYGVVVIDSITHFWEAAKSAYRGRTNRAGNIPITAWGSIKRPYKELMAHLINSPMHVFILGREGSDYSENEETGESEVKGAKMKAENETAYEPHVCIQMLSVKKTGTGNRKGKTQLAVPTAHVEKDRTGLLQGQWIEWPGFTNVIKPMLGLLGMEQAQLPSEDEAALVDYESLRKAEGQKEAASHILRDQLLAKFMLAHDLAGLERVSNEITPAIKQQLLPEDLLAVRQAYRQAQQQLLRSPSQAEPEEPEPAEREEAPHA